MKKTASLWKQSLSRHQMLTMLAGGALLAGCGGGDSNDSGSDYRFAYAFGQEGMTRLALTPNGDVYVRYSLADNRYIEKYPDYGRGTVTNLTAQADLTLSPSPGVDYNIAVSPDSRVVYVAGYGSIQAVDTTGRVLYIMGRNGRGDTTPLYCADIKVANDGVIFALLVGPTISGSGALVGYSPNGVVQTHVIFDPTNDEPYGNRSLQELHAIALSPRNTVFVSLRSRVEGMHQEIREYSVDGTLISTFTPQSGAGQPKFNEQPTYYPHYMTMDGQGNFYFCPLYDPPMSRVSIYRPDGTIARRLEPSFYVGLRLRNFAVDAAGNLYLPGPDPNTGQERILVYTPNSPL